MATLNISQVAESVGLRTSAIRYYEQIGLLEPAERVHGQRRYDESVFYRLSIVQRAQQAGFTLEEVQELFTGFVKGTPAPERWKQLSARKLDELATQMRTVDASLFNIAPPGQSDHADNRWSCDAIQFGRSQPMPLPAGSIRLGKKAIAVYEQTHVKDRHISQQGFGYLFHDW
jgi:MerR family redox-sensitive transcriptional activator SoxR